MLDLWTYRTDYWVSQDNVNVFKNEVKHYVDPDNKKDTDVQRKVWNVQHKTPMASSQMQNTDVNRKSQNAHSKMLDAEGKMQNTDDATQKMEDAAWIDDNETRDTS